MFVVSRAGFGCVLESWIMMESVVFDSESRLNVATKQHDNHND